MEGFVPCRRDLDADDKGTVARDPDAGRLGVLQEAHATRECEEHGWMRDRADPPPGVPPDQAVAEIRDVLNSIGDSCPERPPDCG